MSSQITPLFIIGNPRSGTSLLRQTLNSHPDICIPPESHFFLWLEDKYSSWSINSNLEAYLDDLYNSTKFETWNINRDELKKNILFKRPKNYAMLNEIVYRSYCKSEVKHWGDKNKLWKEKLPSILKYYPNARFVNIIRDGRDVACSYRELAERKIVSKYAPSLPYDIKEIAIKWQSNVVFIDNFLRTLPKEQSLTIRYEDLILNRNKTIRRICNFMQIHFPDGGLDHLNTLDKYSEPEDFLKWKEKIKLPLKKENIEKYKSILTIDQIKEFEKITKRELVQYNYTILDI